MYPNANPNSVSDKRSSKLLLPQWAIAPLSKVTKIDIGKGATEINRENQKSIGGHHRTSQ